MNMPEYVLKIKAELEKLLGCPIEIVEDRDARYPSKMEYARNYGRDRHVVRVNPALCANGFPVFLMLLQAKLQLRKTENGTYGVLQPASNRQNRVRFEEDLKRDPVGQTMWRRYGAGRIDQLVNMLMGGLIAQTSGQVLEMLVADVVLKEYPEAVEDMKAYFRRSAVEGAAMDVEELRRNYPSFLVSANRLMNLCYAMKCGEVCGEKLIDAYRPTPDEIDQALDLYNFYRKERSALEASGKIVGDVVEKVMDYLKVRRYAHLFVNEIAPVEAVVSASDGLTDEQKKSLETFYAHHGDGKDDAELMALGMFKVLREIRNQPMEAVRTLAIEIARLGLTGICAAKKYRLNALAHRGEMWGMEILAYYYVTWAKVFPERLDALGLPYKESYARAVNMLESST